MLRLALGAAAQWIGSTVRGTGGVSAVTLQSADTPKHVDMSHEVAKRKPATRRGHTLITFRM